MSKKLAKDGYSLSATNGGYLRLAQEYPHSFAAAKHSHGMPEGFVPGADECEEKGYNYGSEITTMDGKMFKCVDPTSRKAVWIQVHVSVTDLSYIDDINEAPEAPEEESDPVTTEPDSTEKEVAETTDGKLNRETPLKEFGEIPFVGQMLRDSSIKTIGDVLDAASEGRVADISYMNDDRAKRVVDYLKEQGYLT